MWKDKVFWGSRSSLGMTWNEFSWWVMGAWTHILFSFSIQRAFHIDANSFILFALLFLRHLKGNIGSKVPSQVWWGFLEGQWLLNVIIVCISFFLSKEFQNEWSTLHIPDVVVNQNFGTLELKFNPLKCSWVPALKPNTDRKCICATVHTTSSVYCVLGCVTQSQMNR